MDEPTVGIDPQSRNHILESVKTLNRMGSTVIYTSHYMEEVVAISDRVAIMDQGHVIACGTRGASARVAHEKIILTADGISPELVEELTIHPRVRRVTQKDNEIEVYVPSAQDESQDILFICRNTIQRFAPAVRGAGLETLFLSLTGRTLRD